MTGRKQAEAALQERNLRLAILHEIDRSILAARAPAEIAQAALDRVQQGTGAARFAVALFDLATEEAEILAVAGRDAPPLAIGSRWPLSTGWMMEEIRAGHIATISDVAALPDSDAFRASTLQQGIRSTTIIPMVVGDQVIGQLTIHRAEPGQLPAEVMEFVAHVADSLAVALSNAQLAQQVQAGREQLQALARRLVELQEQERSHVANQLYNEANQVLAVLLVQLSLLEKALAHGQASAERLSEMKRTIDGVMRELHYLATHLRPASLDQLGLAAAVEQYLRAFGHEHGLEAAFAGVELKGLRPPAEVETALYRIVQEALANVAEHAQAGHVSIALTCRGRAAGALCGRRWRRFRPTGSLAPGRPRAGGHARAGGGGGRPSGDRERPAYGDHDPR